MADKKTDSPSNAVTSAIADMIADDGIQPLSADDQADPAPQPATDDTAEADSSGQMKPEPEAPASSTEQGTDEPGETKDAQPDEEPAKAEESEQEKSPVEAAIDELSTSAEDAADDPDNEGQDEEWLRRQKPKTRKRIDRLLTQRNEAREQIATLETQLEETRQLADAGQRLAELESVGLDTQEIETGHAIMSALKNEPTTGVKQVFEYMKTYAEAAGIDLAQVIPGYGQPAADPAQSDAADDIGILVDEGLLSEADAQAILAARQQTQPAPAAPPPPPAQGQGDPDATQLVAGFLASEGIAAADMGSLYQTTLAPEMMRLVQEDGLDVATLTPRQQLRYAQLAWAAKKPAPKSATPGPSNPPPDTAPETSGTQREPPGGNLTPIEAAIADFAFGS